MVPVTRVARHAAARRAGPWLGVAWLWAAVSLYMTWLFWRRGDVGYDSHAYWLAWRHHRMYAGEPNAQDAYLYSPAFAQAIWPLAQLPWALFATFWTTAAALTWAWLLWPVALGLRIPLLIVCLPQVLIGNIWCLLAVVLVLGFRYPGAWSISLLTKVTTSMGIVWFLARREWRPAVRALAVTAVIAAISAVISPALWAQWMHLLLHSYSHVSDTSASTIPLWPRLPAALGLAIYGARSCRTSFLAAAAAVAAPVFAVTLLLSSLFMFAALPRLAEGHKQV